ncbi:hypothetical protein A7K94_0220880, partial [Modestobacter sp. VKM Ac-2676]
MAEMISATSPATGKVASAEKVGGVAADAGPAVRTAVSTAAVTTAGTGRSGRRSTGHLLRSGRD